MSSALVVSGVPEDARNEISIPDVWASIKLFEMALTEDIQSKEKPRKTPVLHERVLQEWRGLLAMLALAEFRELDLAIDRLTLPSPPAAHGAEQTTKDSSFVAAARKLRPKDTTALMHNQTWNEVGRIRYKGRFVAFIVPTVIVCPVRGYERLLDAGIDWVDDNGTLLDPVKVRSLRVEDFAIIGRYCGQLSNRLKELQHDANDPDRLLSDPDRLLSIVSLLETFEKDLEGRHPYRWRETNRAGNAYGTDAFISKAMTLIYRPNRTTMR